MRSIGDHYLRAYLPIVERRKHTPYGERERDFQLYRRGRYVEFNLIYDRGTRYGLQSGRRDRVGARVAAAARGLALRLARPSRAPPRRASRSDYPAPARLGRTDAP